MYESSPQWQVKIPIKNMPLLGGGIMYFSTVTPILCSNRRCGEKLQLAAPGTTHKYHVVKSSMKSLLGQVVANSQVLQSSV